MCSRACTLCIDMCVCDTEGRRNGRQPFTVSRGSS